MNDNDKETMRDLFAGLCAMGLIVRGVPNDFIAQEAYRLADKLMDVRDPEPIGLPAIKRKRTK